jgi:hypothetical protein
MSKWSKALTAYTSKRTMPLLILKQYSTLMKNGYLFQNVLLIEQKKGRLGGMMVLRQHSTGGWRHGISDGSVWALLDAAHNLEVARDLGVNIACAHLGTSWNTRKRRPCLLIWTVVAISQSSSANNHLNPSIHIPHDKTQPCKISTYIDR